MQEAVLAEDRLIARQGAVRNTQVDPPVQFLKMRVFSPVDRFSTKFDKWLLQGFWRRTDQHGRLFYEKMLAHPAVEAAVGSFLSYLVSLDGEYTTQTSDPTDTQKEIADFCNAQVKRLGEKGLPWTAFKMGMFGNGFVFGFSLAEMLVERAPWRNRKNMVQVADIRILPQASLDEGDRPDSFMGEVSTQSPYYNCFSLDTKGNPTAVYQYRNFEHAFLENGVEVPKWEGSDLNNILHFKNGGEDGNPFGRSILLPAAEAWADLYMRERMEQRFLDLTSTPWLHVNRISKDGVPSPAFNTEVKDLIQESDGTNVLITNNAEASSVSAANEDYTEHITRNKKELRQYLAQAVGVPADIYEVTDTNEQNARDKIIFFMKFRAPEKTKRMEDFMTFQFARRLVEQNWSNLQPEDYPVYKTHVNRDDEARTVAGILPVLVKYIDSEKLGEALQALVPGMRREWVPSKHSDSVDAKRPVRDTNDPPPGAPPDRSGARGDGGGSGDGSTKSVGQRVRSSA